MSELTRSDYLRIKWPFVALLASMIFGAGLFGGIRLLDQRASADLRTARTAQQEAQEKVDKIEQEEIAIRANIDDYSLIDNAGLTKGEDRLQMLEHFAQLRARFSLFPVSIEVSEQSALPIAYGELSGGKVDNPGRPVSLQTSNIVFSLPLLHENDLAHLLNGLLEQPELLQVRNCLLTARSGSNTDYVRLGQHFTASCEMAWYTFHIDETAPVGTAKRERK